MLFGIPTTLIVGIVLVIRSEMKKSAKEEEAERKEKELNKFKLDYTLELMMKEPKFKIVFEDSKGQMHETTPINPSIISYEQMRIATSHTMASEILTAAFEQGLIPNKDDIVFPTASLYNAKVVQHVEHVL